jgi:adenylate cyclase
MVLAITLIVLGTLAYFPITRNISAYSLGALAISQPQLYPFAALPAIALIVFVFPPWQRQIWQLLATFALAVAITYGMPPLGDSEIRLVGVLLSALIALAISHLTLNAQQKHLIHRLHRWRARPNKKRQVNAQFKPYLTRQADRAISSGKTLPEIEHRRRYLAVFFIDIHRFTDRIEELEPEQAAEFLNTYLSNMCAIASEFGGTVDKFIGDSLMITFGDNSSSTPEEDVRACMRMALSMREEIHRMALQYADQVPNQPLTVRMGIASGYCTTGNFGAPDRLEYTAIGRTVNLASRLEKLAQPDEILLSSSFSAQLSDEFCISDRGTTQVKGFARPVQIAALESFTADTSVSQPRLQSAPS